MKAIEILKEEHSVIERVLSALEIAANNLQSGVSINSTIFLQAADFSSGFVDGCHHKKEEDALFPAMRAAGIPCEGGPIGVMLAEHDDGRRLSSAMRIAAEQFHAGDTTANDKLVRCVLQYIDHMRQHIAKENGVLFPMVSQVITGSAQSEFAETFEQFEREESGKGLHERFLKLADAIEREVTAQAQIDP